MIYYDVNPILKKAKEIDVPAVAIFGGKGNGKTYGIILKYLKEYMENGRPLRYLRRFKDSIAPKAISSLYRAQIQNIINLSGGKYNSTKYVGNCFYLCRREGNKIVEKDDNPCCICSALNTVETFTGVDYGECSAIFFDEFLSREKELKDEFVNLMIFHDNCVRNRTHYYIPMILVGNTVTRNSILATEFGVNLYEMKQGDITVCHNSKKEPTVICEYCDTVDVMADAGEKYYSRYENDRIKMMYTGAWSVGSYPHLSESKYIDNSNAIFTYHIIAPSKDSLLAVIYKYKSWVYMYVRKKEPKENGNVILLNKITPLQKNMFNYFDRGVRAIELFGEMVAQNRTYFRTNEIGELFRDFLKNFTGGEVLAQRYK